jgi:hypothetical protein
MSIFLIIVMRWTEQFFDNKRLHIMQKQHKKVIICNNRGIKKKLGIFLYKVKAGGKMKQ